MPLVELNTRYSYQPEQATAIPGTVGKISVTGRLARNKQLKLTASKNLPDHNSGHIVPDVRGFSIRKALGILRDEKFSPVVHGSGMVVSQRPKPGEPVSLGTEITLECQQKTSDLGGTK